jgi:hypothetical protein
VNRLAKVLDTDELASARVVAKLRVEVVRGWAGREVSVTVPRRLACSTCDGGGCDACGRSGALRLPDLDVPRKTSVFLPGSLKEGVALRLARPFDDANIDVLLLEVVPAERASAGCELVPATQRHRPANKLAWWVAGVVAILLVVWLVSSRR